MRTILTTLTLILNRYFQKNKDPPNSPDLNPIEIVWHDLKQFVRKCRCTSEAEIIEACQQFLHKITPEYCQNYINKLKQIIQIVIKKKGDWSNY